MSEAPGGYAALTAELIRRAFPALPPVVAAPVPDRPQWQSDARLFLVAWALGFVFFFTFLG